MTLHDISFMIVLLKTWRIAMERFLKRHEGRIKGIISGFDRVLFRGTLRSISYRQGIEKWLWSEGVPLTEFTAFAEKVSHKLNNHAEAFANKHGRPFQYIQSPKLSKQDIAREIMKKDNIKEGLICVLSCVEPCKSFKLKKDRKAKILGLIPSDRQCLHVYFYYVDREFGLMHIRLQTWLPFTIQVCINGWEWLARRLESAGIGYEKRENCFAHIDDLNKAQKMMDSLVERKWARWFNAMARRFNPWIDPKNGLSLHGYYWSIRSGEYSTDVIFKDEDSLKAIYPALLNHAINHFNSKDVLRFLQRRTNTRFSGEIKTELKFRVEGVRIKHMVEENSIKMYDKQGVVLRIETTINNPRRWKVWRRATRKGERVMAWIPMRKGLADIRRRVKVSRAANERYLEALSVVGETIPSHKLLDSVSKQLVRDGRSYRPLRPIHPDDSELFRAMSSGEFLVHGFRNKDLRALLHPKVDENPVHRRQLSARLSRQLRLFRMHGLIFKVSKTHSYRLTKKGHEIMAVAIKLRDINVLEIAEKKCA